MEFVTVPSEKPRDREMTYDEGAVFRCLTRAAYKVGETRVICWLCENSRRDPSVEGERTDPKEVPDQGYSVGIYSAQSGLLRVDFSCRAVAREVFDLLIRFEISPYHVEDVLEDREITAEIRYL